VYYVTATPKPRETEIAPGAFSRSLQLPLFEKSVSLWFLKCLITQHMTYRWNPHDVRITKRRRFGAEDGFGENGKGSKNRGKSARMGKNFAGKFSRVVAQLYITRDITSEKKIFNQ
jgi:hypothetical protein